MLEFVEGRRKFQFADTWQVVKYDADHAHLRVEKCVDGSKAVDFFGIHDEVIYLFEVKDYASYERENRRRLSSGEIAQVIAQKVRDSISSAVAAARRDGKSTLAGLLGRRLARSESTVLVVFFAQPPDGLPEKDRKQFLNIQLDLLEARLRWLKADVLVVSHAEFSELIPNAKSERVRGG